MVKPSSSISTSTPASSPRPSMWLCTGTIRGSACGSPASAIAAPSFSSTPSYCSAVAPSISMIIRIGISVHLRGGVWDRDRTTRMLATGVRPSAGQQLVQAQLVEWRAAGLSGRQPHDSGLDVADHAELDGRPLVALGRIGMHADVLTVGAVVGQDPHGVFDR